MRERGENINTMNPKVTIWIAGGAIAAVAGAFVIWLFFFNTLPNTPINPIQTGLGTGGTKSVGVATTNPKETNSQTAVAPSNTQKVFKIAAGPVTGATFIQTFTPTTTLARYVLQENGHVLDQPIDVPGSLARATSNTTIPGTARTLWGNNGNTLIMQYLDQEVIKTVSLLFFTSSSSKSVSRPAQLQFLPDAMADIAVSPSGTQVAYLLRSGRGVDGYTADVDGNNIKKIFTLGFSELLLSWPSPNTLLLNTKSAENTPGVVFSVDIKTGGVTPLIYALGVTATADPSFSYILYQSDPPGENTPRTYTHNIAANTDIRLSFNPIPEKCVWRAAQTHTAYCATPREYFNSSYLDRWHQGAASISDAITAFTFDNTSDTSIVARPGGSDGGEASDVAELAVSPDGKYLLFVKKGDRSLWGVRLAK